MKLKNERGVVVDAYIKADTNGSTCDYYFHLPLLFAAIAPVVVAVVAVQLLLLLLLL